MTTAVITGGTDGIGRALAETYLARGHTVVVIGRNEGKGLDLASRHKGAHFLRADLSLVSENTRVIGQIRERFDSLDLLVLGARFHQRCPVLTEDGFERCFSLFYLSRYLLSHGLYALLAAAPDATILNFGASWQISSVNWTDLQLLSSYNGIHAMGHAGHLNDLLAVDLTARFADLGVRNVVNHPGVVATSFAGEYDAATRQHVESIRSTAKPVGTAVAQILPYLDHPLTNLAFVYEGQRLPIQIGDRELADARRLALMTEHMLHGNPRRAS